MVVILEQSVDNGSKFNSTLVDCPSFSLNSSFSTSNLASNPLNSYSISEQSAVYKQRIDSLFGRSTNLKNLNKNKKNQIIYTENTAHQDKNGLNLEPRANNYIITSIGPNLESNCSKTRVLAHIRDDFKTKGEAIADNCSNSKIDTILDPSKIADNFFLRNDPDLGSKTENKLRFKIGATSECRIDVDKIIKKTQNPEINMKEPTGSSLSQLNVSSIKLNGEEDEIGVDKNDEIWAKSEGSENIKESSGAVLQFPVEYLGSIPVEGTSVGLHDLQTPLSHLYLNYLSGENIQEGQLSIMPDGLRFESPKLRLVNPFSTISVWAAIKFVSRGESDCAFMPLISDPEGSDKRRLFEKMSPQLSALYFTSIQSPNFKNPPIFACVMREASFRLNCHAFACACAEDAIVVAANLYQSLVEKMKICGREGESGYGSLTRNSQQASPASSGSQSETREVIKSQSESRTTGESQSESRILSQSEVRLSAKSQFEPRNILASQLELRNALNSQIKARNSKYCQNNDGKNIPGRVRVMFSDTEDSSAPIRPPRRKNRPSYKSESSQFKIPQRKKSFKASASPYRSNYAKNTKKRVQISVPEEMTSSSDNISSTVEDVLDRIVSPAGMSFSDLNESYQELILKIALTLTQDQLYQKSKEAMKKNKTGKNLGGSEPNNPILTNFFKPFTKNKHTRLLPNKKAPKIILKKREEETENFTSFCSGCMCESCSEKCYCSLPQKLKNAPLGVVIEKSEKNSPSGSSVSENEAHNNGHCCAKKSKNLCGYDTDSCAESEKCYCSLKGVKSNGLKVYNINLDTETSDTDTNSYDLEPFSQHKNCFEDEELLIKNKTSVKNSIGRGVEILSYNMTNKSDNKCAHLLTTNAIVHAHAHEHEKECSLHHQSILKKERKKIRGKGSELTTNSLIVDANEPPPQNLISRKKVLLITGATPSPQIVYKNRPFLTTPPQNHDMYTPASSSAISRLLKGLGHISENETIEEGGVNEKSEEEEEVVRMKKTAEIQSMFSNLRVEGERRRSEINSSGTSCSIFNNRIVGNEDVGEMGDEGLHSTDFHSSLGYLP